MAIKITSDVGAPLAVTAADLLTESMAPEANEPVSYLLAALGYLGAGMGFGGDFVKNIGVSSLPWAAKNIYTRVRKSAGVTRVAVRRPVSTYPQNPAGFDKTVLI